MIYWSRTRMKAHTRRQETSQRAFLLPRELQEWDSHAVESTSYALLVLLAREGVTSTTERIMRWLNAVRDWDRAFMSTVVSISLWNKGNCFRSFRLNKVSFGWPLELEENLSFSTDSQVLILSFLFIWFHLNIRQLSYLPQDTVVAMEALAEYAFIARLRDLTEIECTLDVTSEETQSVHLSISNVSTASYHTFEVRVLKG